MNNIKIFNQKNLFVCIFLLIAHRTPGQNFEEGLIAFDNKDYSISFNLLKPYADSGNCLAQFVIGFSYQYGLSVIKDDSLAKYYLELSAVQKQPLSMGPLAANYFSNADSTNRGNLINAYMWSMLAAEYDDQQKYKATRYVIKQYLTEDEIELANEKINTYILKWKDKDICK